MSCYTEELKRAFAQSFDTEYSSVSTPSTKKMTNKQVKARNKNKRGKQSRKKQRR